MDSTRKFLDAVLPAKGVYCAFTLPKRNHFFLTIDGLATFLNKQDAKGLTVYHACASYKDDSSRLASNVECARSLWLDVDVGPKKPYATVADAYQAVEAFRAQHKLPLPIYVSSGNGLHVYWPLQKMLSLAEWLKYAEGLKHAASVSGLHAGPERTADAASVLRPPGTHNRKDAANPKLVEVGKIVGPYPRQLFDALYQNESNILHLVTGVNVKRAQILSPLAAACISEPDFPPADANRIADNCAQLRQMRDTQGLLSEPEWKACISVLAFCENGRALAHEWSKGDERYDARETDAKFDRSTQLSGPTTCLHFSTLNTQCQHCPYRGEISCPTQLSSLPATIVLEAAPPDIEEDIEFPQIPGFGYYEGALIFEKADAKGKRIPTLVTQYPVYMERVSRSESGTHNYTAIFRFKPPHEEWQRTELPLKILFSPQGISELAGKGIITHDGELFKKFARVSIDILNSKGPASMQYEQLGWKEDDTAFLIGNRLFRADEIEEVDSSPDVLKFVKELVPTPKGSLSAWKNAADQLFGEGVEAQGFALLASFAAPLMRFHSHNEGGALVSIISRDSGKGKTTALEAAGSVWGQIDSFKLINIDTKVSKGRLLGVVGNLPVLYEELSSSDPEIIKEFVQIVTNGRDKRRGTKEGLLAANVNSWQTLLIAGSNSSLVDIIKSTKGTEAMGTRIIELQVNLPDGVKHWKGDGLKDELRLNAGYAGEAYIKYLVRPKNLAYVKKTLPMLREEIIKKYGFKSEHRFWARTLASVMVAAKIVTKLGLVSFSPDKIIEWTIESLLGQKESERVTAVEGSHVLARFLAHHLPDTLVMPRAWKPGERVRPLALKLPARNLLVRYEVENGRVSIDEKTLRTWMVAEGVSWQNLIRELREKGILLHPRRLVTLGSGTDLTNGQVPCLEVNAKHPAMSGVLPEAEEKAA